MNSVPDAYGSRGSNGVAGDGPWQQLLLRSVRVGSAGVVVPVHGYGAYLPHVGTSPTVFDSRGMMRISPAPTFEAEPAPTPEVAPGALRTTPGQAAMRMSSADQALEVLAALSLNKTLLAEVLRVSRPTLYDWLEGKEPNPANAQRLTTLVQLLVNSGVTAADAISTRFVRQPLSEGEPSLLDLLKADPLDRPGIARAVAEAKALEDDAEKVRQTREARLADLEFFPPSDAQRKANLALNVALRPWPKE